MLSNGFLIVHARTPVAHPSATNIIIMSIAPSTSLDSVLHHLQGLSEPSPQCIEREGHDGWLGKVGKGVASSANGEAQATLFWVVLNEQELWRGVAGVTGAL